MAANGESEKSEENQAGIDWGIRGRPSFAFHPVICLFLHQKALRLLIVNLWPPIIAPGREEKERVEFT